ncbi:hypothetical protein GCM10027610_047130 [Dactylosporangium cerinum]
MPTPKRSAAATPATPSEDRWNTAMMYAVSPIAHMTCLRMAPATLAPRGGFRAGL